MERAAGGAAGAGRGDRRGTGRRGRGRPGRHGRAAARGGRRVAVVAARPRRAAALPDSSVRLLAGDAGAGRRGSGRSASAPSRSTRRRTRTGRRSPSSSTASRSSCAGANWIPDDCFPSRIDRARYERSIGRRHRQRHQPAAGLGRRDLRERGLLRDLRRDGPDGLAGLPVRLRRVRRGGAAARRGRGRGAGGGHAAHRRTRAWCCGTAATRTSGATRTGAGRSRSATCTWGMGYYTEVLPAIVAELDPARPYSAGQPVVAGHLTSPQRPRPRHACTSGTSGTSVDYTVYRDYVPRLRVRVRLPGAAGVVDADPRRARRAAAAATPPGCCCTRRPRTATPSSPAASRRTSAVPAGHGGLALGDVAAPGPGRRLRRRALPVLGTALRRHDRLAAQRLLAGHVLGRRRR